MFEGFETDIENNHLLAAVSDNSKIKLGLTDYNELKDFEAKVPCCLFRWRLVNASAHSCSAARSVWSTSCSPRRPDSTSSTSS